MHKQLYLCLFLLAGLTAQAQVFLPLESNPVLRSEQTRRLLQEQQMLKEVYGLEPSAGTVELRNIIPIDACVQAGTNALLCIDTFGLGGPLSSLNCLNCGDAEFGTAGLDSTCIDYAADPAVIFGMDTLLLEFCGKDSICDTFQYFIVAHRQGSYTVEPELVLNAETQVSLPLDVDALPTPPGIPEFLECRDPLLSTSYVLNDQLFYTTQRFAGRDTVCLVLSDQFCISDTVVFPFRILQDTIPLGDGFLDDFSYPGPYPTNRLWLDRNAYVNNTMAFEPPNLGVATLDGLSPSGTPYEGGLGTSDRLTSIYLNLEGESTVYLSFFFQPKGLGYSVDPSDSLLVEFKGPDGTWDRMDGFAQDTFYDFFENGPNFRFRVYQLAAEYVFNGFQFRFRNISENEGGLKPWHIDMVRLTRNLPQLTFGDVAFTRLPDPILRRYTAMPWNQFKADVAGELRQSFSFEIKNNFNEILALTENNLRIRPEPFAGSADLVPPFNLVNAQNLEAGQRLTSSRPLDPIFNDFQQNVSALPDQGDFQITTQYQSVSSKDADQLEFPGIIGNDTVRRVTVFDDYYAYDDGTAEARITPGTAGNRVAVKYTTNVPDTLRAIQMNIPYFPTAFDGRTFRLQAWIGELDNEPEYEVLFQEPFYLDRFKDTLNGFITYVLLDIDGQTPTPLPVPAGDFWIGWETNTTQIPVGFDRNNPGAAPNNFAFFAGDWFRMDTIFTFSAQGAVMIRPVMGSGMPVNTPTTAEVPEAIAPDLTVFPNPSQGVVFFETDLPANQWELELLDPLGRPLGHWAALPTELDLRNYPDGCYVLRFKEVLSGKRIVRPLMLMKTGP